MSFKNDFNLFIGGTGSLKGIKVENDNVIVKNFQNTNFVTKDQEITCMTWGGSDEKDILIATANQTVKVYDSEFKAYCNSVETKFGQGPIVGVARINGAITTCVESGHIKIWRHKQSEQVEIITNKEVNCMKNSFISPEILATGGPKNDLKLWSAETKQTIFTAKNVKKELELEVPVWVSDICFLPKSNSLLAYASRHGHVRLYDIQAQRRPVLNVNIPNQTLTALCIGTKENQVIIGSGTGHMLRLDLRMGKVINSYKGSTGSIRQIACSHNVSAVASVGLDRHLRIYALETGKPQFQIYLKVKLNSLLMRSNYGLNEKEDKSPQKSILDTSITDDEHSDDDIVVVRDDEYEAMFENMDTIGDKRKSNTSVNSNIKSKKCKAE